MTRKDNKKRTKLPLRLVQLTAALGLLAIVAFIFLLFAERDRPDGPGPGQGSVVDNRTPEPVRAVETPAPQGSITITSRDASDAQPIRGAAFEIVDLASSAVVDTLVTDEEGRATSKPLDYGTRAAVRQLRVSAAYAPLDEERIVEIAAPNQDVVTENRLRDYVQETKRNDEGELEITKVYLDVATLMQKPELPNGCEITSLTAVLNFYGYDADKLDMADNYLPKEPWNRKNGKLFGADPYKAYAGDPRDQPGGFFSYAPPIVAAADRYLGERDASGLAARDISGSTREELLEHLYGGTPVVVWTTLDMSPPKVTYSWYFHDTGELFKAPVNLHVLVLNGYDAGTNTVHVMNPLEGQVTYNADTFFKSYEEMGSHALVVERADSAAR
jgi:Uncharacterized protein conserved in bacteria